VRIVVVTTSFPRTAEDPSGHFVQSSAQALAARGHDVHVIAPGGSPFDAPSKRGDLWIHRAGGGALFAWPGAIARMREAPWRALAVAPFALGVRSCLTAIGAVDRAVAHWIVPSAFPLLMSARAPLEVHAHGADVRLLVAAPRPVREAVMRALLEHRARFTFAARSLLTALEGSIQPELGAALRCVAKVEPPPLDLPDVSARARELRASLRLVSGERLAVAVARLVSSKRIELAIEAMRAAPRWRLWVVGDGPERASLEQLASERGVVARFVGHALRREALAWIAASDALVHPSAVEAAPTAVREARALGVPVVACEAGDVAAWAQDDAGIQVVAASAEAIAAALIEAPLRAASAPN